MTASRVAPALALAAGLFLAAGSVAQQPKIGQPPPAFVPVPAAPELPVVPKSAGAFISLKVSDVIDHPDLKAVLEQLKKTPEALEGVTEMFGVAPHEIDRLTVFWPAVSPRGPTPSIVVVTTREAYNEARVLKLLKAEPVFDDDGGHGHGHGFGEGRARDAAARNLKQLGGAIHQDHDARPTKSAPVKTDPEPAPDTPKPPEPTKKDSPEDDDGPTFPVAAAFPVEPLFYEVQNGPFELLFLADDRTLVFLPDGPYSFNVMAFLAQLLQKKSTGPLADAIKGAGNHTLAAGVYLPPLFREFDRGMPRELAPYAALATAKVATLTGDLGKTAKFTLKLTFDDAAAARRAAPVLEEGLKEFAGKIAEELTRMKDGRGPEKALAPLAEALAAGLTKATVKAEGTSAVASAEVDAGPAAARGVADLLQSVKGRKQFLLRANDLKQIGIALHAYHDANNKLPTNVYGPKGEPLLSWRVHLLPYLEQENLYRQFKMDEAWDGPNNKALIERMPKVFETAGREGKKGHTFYQAFVSPDPTKPPAKGGPGVGPGGLPGEPGFGPPGGFGFGGTTWLVEGGKNPSRLTTITDGTSNTIAVVEARDGVVWSKPDDLPFGAKLPPLGAERAERFMALFLDGHVSQIPTNVRPDTLRALLTANGGEVVSDDFDDGPRGFRFGGRGGVGASSGPGVAQAAAREEELVHRLESLRRAEAELDRARAEFARAQAEAALATAELERLKKLFADGLAKKEDFEKAQAEYQVRLAVAKEREVLAAALAERLEAERRALEKDGVVPARPATKK